jgi:hypothetical protein
MYLIFFVCVLMLCTQVKIMFLDVVLKTHWYQRYQGCRGSIPTVVRQTFQPVR